MSTNLHETYGATLKRLLKDAWPNSAGFVGRQISFDLKMCVGGIPMTLGKRRV